MRPSGDWMDGFQTDSKIGFQFIPSEKLSLVANYSHCQLTSQPALSKGLQESACQIYSCPSRQSRWWKQTGNFCGAKILACNSRQLRQGLVSAQSEACLDVVDMKIHVCLNPIPGHSPARYESNRAALPLRSVLLIYPTQPALLFISGIFF